MDADGLVLGEVRADVERTWAVQPAEPRVLRVDSVRLAVRRLEGQESDPGAEYLFVHRDRGKARIRRFATDEVESGLVSDTRFGRGLATLNHQLHFDFDDVHHRRITARTVLFPGHPSAPRCPSIPTSR